MTLPSKRRAVSRVTIDLAVLVVGVSLALLILSPAGDYILRPFKRVELVGGHTTIEVMVATRLGSDRPVVYVRNLGPRGLELGSKKRARDPSLWQVVIDDEPLEVVDVAEKGREDNVLRVDEVITLTVKSEEGKFSSPKEHRVVVCGPGATWADPPTRGRRPRDRIVEAVKRLGSRTSRAVRSVGSRISRALRRTGSKVARVARRGLKGRSATYPLTRRGGLEARKRASRGWSALKRGFRRAWRAVKRAGKRAWRWAKEHKEEIAIVGTVAAIGIAIVATGGLAGAAALGAGAAGGGAAGSVAGSAVGGLLSTSAPALGSILPHVLTGMGAVGGMYAANHMMKAIRTSTRIVREQARPPPVERGGMSQEQAMEAQESVIKRGMSVRVEKYRGMHLHGASRHRGMMKDVADWLEEHGVEIECSNRKPRDAPPDWDGRPDAVTKEYVVEVEEACSVADSVFNLKRYQRNADITGRKMLVAFEKDPRASWSRVLGRSLHSWLVENGYRFVGTITKRFIEYVYVRG